MLNFSLRGAGPITVSVVFFHIHSGSNAVVHPVSMYCCGLKPFVCTRGFSVGSVKMLANMSDVTCSPGP